MTLSRPVPHTVMPRVRRSITCYLCLQAAVLAACLPVHPCSAAKTAYLVNEKFTGSIWRLDDLNANGDALDIGEKKIWASGFTGSFGGMYADRQAVYVTQQGTPGGARVLRMIDLNNDGDALDIGENTVWLDNLPDAGHVTHDPISDHWFVSDAATHRVWRLDDLNQDGDVLDIGERTLFADGIASPHAMLPLNNALLVASADPAGSIHRLIDLNGDGDTLDVGENLPIATGFGMIRGMLADGNGGFFFTASLENTIYHARDLNADQDLFDTAEVLSYSDSVFGGLNSPQHMTPHPFGGFLLTNFNDGRVLHIRDANGDSDALDLGDSGLFADGFSLPVGIVTLSIPGIEGDLNCDGFVGIADLNIVLGNWNQNVSPGDLLSGDPSGDGFVGIADLNTVLGNWNAGIPPTNNVNIPEPTTLLLLTPALLATTQRRTH